MDQIRPFRNSDLPDVADIWIRHWSAVMPSPPVSVAMMEQALFARTFFDASNLLIARRDDATVGWCHVIPGPEEHSAIVAGICFSPEGLALCDALLHESERRTAQSGYQTMQAGPFRDRHCGYAGLAPVGHGIGVPTTDTRTSSLLSRRGFGSGTSVERLAVPTSPYRPAVNRDWLQLRRSTRIEQTLLTPADARTASAMAHLDIEQHRLIDYRTGKEIASVELWTSDPEAQVMSCADAILELGTIYERGQITTEEGYLISTLIQSLSNRRIFNVQTAIESEKSQLIDQLVALGLRTSERGHRLTKPLIG